MIGQCAAMSPKVTVPARNGSAVATTTRLVALLRMTASERCKVKETNEQRQAELGATEPDQPAQCSDDGAGNKGQGLAARLCVI